MEVDISESKSRAFNIFLRFIQLSLCTVIALYVCELDNAACDNSFFKLIAVVGYIMLAANLVAILYMRCREEFSKIAFYIFLTADLLLAGIVLVVAFAGFGQSNVCANNKVFFKFAVAEVIVIVVLTLFILFSAFYWVQRFSNSPGNLAWIFLFFGFAWSEQFGPKMTALGALCLTVSLITLLANAVAAWKGITIGTKKIVVGCWTLDLLLMFVNEVVAIAVYFQNSDTSSYNDVAAKKILQTFLAINVIEFLLWIFGLLTLKYENGDPIRDSLLNFGRNDEL